MPNKPVKNQSNISMITLYILDENYSILYTFYIKNYIKCFLQHR